ncbi:hypothetical protein C5C11_03735 [Rathayibacter rathayi]|nr:hypothetical protein C5C11_03735 [Rathayibacter rathayi]
MVWNNRQRWNDFVCAAIREPASIDREPPESFHGITSIRKRPAREPPTVDLRDRLLRAPDGLTTSSAGDSQKFTKGRLKLICTRRSEQQHPPDQPLNEDARRRIPITLHETDRHFTIALTEGQFMPNLDRVAALDARQSRLVVVNDSIVRTRIRFMPAHAPRRALRCSRVSHFDLLRSRVTPPKTTPVERRNVATLDDRR